MAEGRGKYFYLWKIFPLGKLLQRSADHGRTHRSTEPYDVMPAFRVVGWMGLGFLKSQPYLVTEPRTLYLVLWPKILGTPMPCGQ